MLAQAISHPDSLPIGTLWRHFAYLRLYTHPATGGPGRRQDWRGDWRDACYRLTPRVERVGTGEVLLDLGECVDAEALAALHAFLRQAADAGWRGRAGIGPSCIVAQVAASLASPECPLMLIPPQLAPALLRTVPMALLRWLHPRGTLTTETVDRLRRYGLGTLGRIARLDENALRRQFGNTAGAFLAAAAIGRDVQPFRPDSPPARLGVRVRLATPLAGDPLLALLPMLGERVARELRRRARRARMVHVRIGWEDGARQRVAITLRQHTDDPRVLAGTLRRLLLPLLQSDADSAVTGTDTGPIAGIVGSAAIATLRVTLEDFASAAPIQTTLWRTRDAQFAALEEVADVLRQRHGRPLLHRLRLVAPAAIFPEDRYRLLPLPCADEDMGRKSGERYERVVSSSMPPQRPRRHAVADKAGASAVWERVPLRLHWW